MKKTERSYGWDTLAGRLRFLLKEKGIKQKEFAEICGVSDNYISMLVTGRRDGISEPLCRLICQNYGIHPLWLREGLGEPYIDQESIDAAYLREQLTDKLETMDSASLRILLDALGKEK